MRWAWLAVLSLAVGAGSPAQEPDEPPPLHTERGVAGTIKIERRGHYNRLVIRDLLWGTQIHDPSWRHWLDDFQYLIPGSPWDTLLAGGAMVRFDPRQEPLSYFHRTGPVGAIFRELRTRKDGADASSPIAVLGLGAGTEAAYARPGQSFTYYETDPALKRLVADSDKYFTYVTDARKRGAEIEFRIGNRREKLKEDKDKKFSLILVDQAESYPFARDVFSKEAVQLYLNRLTADGLVGLHISNKYIHTELMLATLADELKLAARTWPDGGDNAPGKTASSWVVLARNEQALGTLAFPEQIQDRLFGAHFRPLDIIPGVPAWTDAHAEEFAIMFNPVVQRVRGHFGLPVPYRGNVRP